MTPVHFNNTVLRDGHQSLAATRMSTDQMLPAAPVLDGMGFHGLETWGGAAIDACLRFLGEQPFDRIRRLKAVAPRTPQIMLLRGQNIVQYTSFPDDVVEAFVRATAAAGMDVFRVFDALNDLRNVRTAILAVKAAGRHARGEICYTTSPVHTVEAFLAFARGLKDLGCDSISIKDMSGIITPRVAHDLVAALRRDIGLPVILHSHETAGLAAASYLAAIEAGVDVIETSIVPFANGTSQPDTLRMMALLEGHPRYRDFDRARLQELREHFTRVYAELAHVTKHQNEVVDTDTLVFQVPGGMLSNFRAQLAEQKMADREPEVLQEMVHVRRCLGWIPLVTPTSQIVGTQAMLNVKFGRWKNFSKPAMDVALGKYGRTPGPVDPEVRQLAAQRTGEEPMEERPADRLAPRMEALRGELRAQGLPADDEHAVLHAMFPVELAKLYAPKPAPVAAAAPKPAAPAPEPEPAAAAAAPAGPRLRRYTLLVEGHRHEVLVEDAV